jgi:hypothetical protein
MYYCGYDDRDFVMDSVILHQLGSPDEIELYNSLSVALELMEDDDFTVASSSIGGGIDFSIITKYPNKLPERVAMLFFNIDCRKYKVSVEETDMYVDIGERNYQVKIKKY